MTQAGYRVIYTPTTNVDVKLEVFVGSFNSSPAFSLSATIKQIGIATNLLGTLTATDSSSVGYMDIGNMRMQWGVTTVASFAETITMPASFANTSYSVVMTCESGTNVVARVNSGSKTVNSFQVTTVLTNTGVLTAATKSWQAMGQKP